MDFFERLARDLDISEQDVRGFALTAPNRYKIYRIPKRTSGSRVIAHPSRMLKAYQRLIISYVTELLPVHSCAYAYRQGVGIKDNARVHAKSSYLLKMDLQNFFNSINPSLFFDVVEKVGLEVADRDKWLLTKLLFWSPNKSSSGRLILSVGAPSSPLVSNFIMYPFDIRMSEYCFANGLKYTRYADDITLSTNKRGCLFDLPDYIKGVLANEYQGKLSVNESKTVFSSKAHNRHVTGITITNKGSLSIGRQRKRYISSLIYQFSSDQLDPDDTLHLKGLLSFAFDVEPDLRRRFEKKYTSKVIHQILTCEKGND
ncbi:retron St85 family RNA-directed DNA polymerase [Reinekea marinisedimentorum]|uniref:RNA-directed DNA polymerase n=1 Tax=Reinekea marinisedimentorum TaxID=230495 RepID=A0A4R3HXQ0_9GAMM|nr:retron St85 family RNA-directed DNA polymerase [Reinekea marinisedimentorum]TCS38086.1 retron-type reverse transcriptase [Reinekea marinisedimentorum]